MSFDRWMAKVNQALEDMVGLDSRDLPDWCYRDAFDTGMAPDEAADDVLCEAGLIC